MYKVYCDGALIYESGDDERTLLNPKVDIEVNKAGSMDFIILPEHISYDKINKLKSCISVKQDGKEIWAGRPTDVLTDFLNRKKVHCEGELAYLNDSVQRPKEYKGVSVIGYLNHLIDNHNAQVDDDKKFKVGVVTVRDSNDYLLRYTNWETTLKTISEDLVDSLGGYIFIRNEDGVRYIDYLADFMHTNTQKIEFGENMLDFSKNFDTTDVATCVIPLGARLENPKIEALGERLTIESVNGGVDSIISQEAAKLYGKISKTVIYDDVKVPANLLKKGTDYLKAAQWERMTLEAKALDLHFVEGSFEQFKVGEYVRVVSKPHGMNANFPLVKMSIKLDKVSDNTITLGTKKNLSLSAATIESSSEIKKQLEMVPKRYDVIKLAKENATNIITKVMGGFVVKTENELLVMDTNDIKTAKNVWRWNVNGLGFSRNGYDGPYETAMTMDGAFVADMITTGILKGGNVHFNLNEGTFLIGESEDNYLLKFDGSTLKFGSGSIGKGDLSEALKQELKGENGKDGKDGKIKYNLISNGDFHNDFTKDEPSDTSQKLNEWQVAAKRMKRVHILPAGGKWIMAVKASNSAVEVNQYLDLKDNTKYYVKFKATSNNMSLYYYGTNYIHLAKVTELDRDNPKVYSAEFTTHKVYPHKIQFDCRQFSEIHWIILSESPIPDDTDWYPSKQDSIGKQGPPGRDGKQGPPGKDGSMVDLPPALKAWNSKATEISGKYVYTPELFVGNGSYENKTGIYMGKNIRAKFHDSWQEISGMVGMTDGEVNWMFTHSGNLVIGRKFGECIQLGADGRAIIPMIKTNMIEAGAITADKIRSGTITANEIAAKTITSAEIKSGAITTDFLYPGTSERIVLERGYSPGANNCKSIDANGNAIRLKANAGTYIAMRDSGSVGMYSGGSLFFNFNPNENWTYDDPNKYATGSGVLNLFDAHVMMGWLQYYVYSVRSDRRVKNNIKYIKNNDSTINRNNIFNFVKSVDLATYKYKKIGGNNLSMIAQDVLKFRYIKDYLIAKDSNGLLSINMGNYTSMLHVTLQEEIKKREELETKVSTLDFEILSLKAVSYTHLTLPTM